MTPPATSAILPGITRDSIMTLARDRGYEVRETNIAREALYLADEVFMTGTAAEIVPVATIDKIEVGNGKREYLSQKYCKTPILACLMAPQRTSGAG